MDKKALGNGGYAQKMNAVASKAFSEWWNSLTKEEILEYLLEQPTVTADNLRGMLANEQGMLAFDIQFSVASLEATTDFHTETK